MVILANDNKKLQAVTAKAEEGVQEYGGENKVRRLNDTENMNIMAMEGKTKQIEKYRYLGSMLTADCKNEIEVKTRILIANRKNLFCSMTWR